MTKTFQQEIDLLKKICFNIDYENMDSKRIHMLLSDAVVSTFTSLGYTSVIRKKVKFEKVNPRTLEFQGKYENGTIDLLLYKNKIKIGVEVNRGSILKIKSISKLFASDSILKIAVLYPKRSGSVKDKETTDRIRQIKKKRNLSTQVLIINVKDKKSYSV